MKVYFWGFSFTLHWIHPVECDCVRSKLQMRKYSSGINAIFFLVWSWLRSYTISWGNAFVHSTRAEDAARVSPRRARGSTIFDKNWLDWALSILSGLGERGRSQVTTFPLFPVYMRGPTFPFSFSFNFRFSLLTRHWSKLFVAYSNFIPFFTYIFKVVTS